MKIKIITIHNIPNFGSVFQSFALGKYLKQLDFDVEVIDYNPTYFKLKTLRSKIGMLLNLKHYIIRKKKFRRFVIKNIPLTKKVFWSLEDLKCYNFDADVIMAGGDQLWNVYHSCGNDDAYKLTWTDKKKISYATSMGQKGFSESQLCDLANKIRDFAAISVRESSSVELLKMHNIHAVHCVDPVFLLNPSEYNQFIKPPKLLDKYLLVYLVTPSPLLERCIKFFKQRFNLKIVLCSGFSKKCYCDVFYKDLGPDEILSYIYNAEIVLSASFHATAFSTMFKKQFFTILPNEHTNERIVDYLNDRGLNNRIITEEICLEEKLCETLDYSVIKDYQPNIIESQKYLKQVLNYE